MGGPRGAASGAFAEGRRSAVIRYSPIYTTVQKDAESLSAGGETETGRDVTPASRGEPLLSPRVSPRVSPVPSNGSVRAPPGRVGQPEQASLQAAGLEQTSAAYQSALSTALLAQQLPPIGNFSGEMSLADGETFEAWREQFEMVASVSRWGPQAKLVNLTTRLKGQAYTFYRSCTPLQRASYDLLVDELTKRFTLVRLQSVQSTLFHERKQRDNESVDNYAQDLRKLFRLAYPKARQELSVIRVLLTCGACPR